MKALLVVLKVLAALGNEDFVDVITDICIDIVSSTSPRCSKTALTIYRALRIKLLGTSHSNRHEAK